MAHCHRAASVNMNVWLWLGLAAGTFVICFLMSWLQMRRLKRRVDDVVANEIARRIRQRILDEARGVSSSTSRRSDSDNRKADQSRGE